MKVFGSRNESRLSYPKSLLKYVVPRKSGETVVCCVGFVLFKTCRLRSIGRIGYDSLGHNKPNMVILVLFNVPELIQVGPGARS